MTYKNNFSKKDLYFWFMKKIIGVLLSTAIIIAILYYLFIYFVTYSTGVRSGELIKISRLKAIMLVKIKPDLSIK